jgi:hypothetical protein
MFVIIPECLVSLLFCSKMDDNEAILLRGVERFSLHKGYAFNFEFDKNFEEKIEFDDDNHLKTQIVAIDALMGRNDIDPNNIKRELLKCVAGFSKWSKVDYFPLATGIFFYFIKEIGG